MMKRALLVGFHHDLVVAKRDAQIGEGQLAMAGRHELLAWDFAQYV